MVNFRKAICLLFAEKGYDTMLLMLRIFFGIMIIHHGVLKIEAFDTTADSFADPFGLGSRLSYILILCVETIGGALLILGLFTRLAAFALACGMLTAIMTVHQPFTLAKAEMPLLYLAVFICLIISGAGRYSADRYFNRKCYL